MNLFSKGPQSSTDGESSPEAQHAIHLERLHLSVVSDGSVRSELDPTDQRLVTPGSADHVDFCGAFDCLKMMERNRRLQVKSGPAGDSNGADTSMAADTSIEQESLSVADLFRNESNISQTDVDQIGRFKIVRRLGAGGNGVVLLAVDPDLNRQVALKIPNPQALLRPEFMSRFQREARLAAKLSHPNIIPVHETGRIGPVCYIATEYCDGPDLRQWLASHPQPLDDRPAAQLLQVLSEAVQHAHRHGVLHRDIKPSNIMFEAAGGLSTSDLHATARLTDFGLAKSIEDDHDVTATSAILGTPAYMAPEQAEGRLRDIGTHTDIFALGCILYELLTGQSAFGRETSFESMRAVRTVDPKLPSKIRGSVASDLEAICMRCLEKESDRRYPSAGQLAEDLRNYLDGRPVSARPLTTIGRYGRWCRRKPLVATLLMTVGILTATLTIGSTLAAVSLAKASSNLRASRGELAESLKTERNMRDLAERRERKSMEHLFQSLLSHARASRASGVAGQRFTSLESIKRAVPLGRELGVDQSRILELRNEAIAAMSILDIRKLGDWKPTSKMEGMPTKLGPEVQNFPDPSFQRYATIENRRTEIRIRNTASHEQIGPSLTVKPGGGIVGALAWSPDGQSLAARFWKVRNGRANPRWVGLWNLKTGKKVYESTCARPNKALAIGTSPSFDFSPDNRWLAVCRGKRVEFINLESLVVEQIVERKLPPTLIRFSRDGTRFALGDHETVDLYGAESFESQGKIPNGHALGLAWNEDDTRIAIAGVNSTASVYDSRSYKEEWVFRGHGGSVQSVCFVGSSQYLASASWEGTTRFWNLGSGLEELQIEGALICASSDGALLGMPDSLCQLSLPESDLMSAGPTPPTRTRRPSRIKGIDFHFGGRLMVGGNSDKITLWDLGSRKVLASGPADQARSWFSADGRRLLTVTAAGVRSESEVQSRESDDAIELEIVPVQRIEHEANEAEIAGSPKSNVNSKIVVLQSGGPTTKLLDLETGERNELSLGRTNMPVVSPNGRFVAVAYRRHMRVEIREIEGNRLLHTIATRSTRLKFSPNAETLVVSRANQTEFYRSDGPDWSGKLVCIQRIEKNPPGSRLDPIEFTRDGAMVAIRGPSVPSIALLDAHSFETLATFAITEGRPPRGCWITPDSSTMIVAMQTPGYIRCWNLNQIRSRLRDLGLDWSAKPLERSLDSTKPIRLIYDHENPPWLATP